MRSSSSPPLIAGWRQVAGRGIPVPGNDIDTDRIIPANSSLPRHLAVHRQPEVRAAIASVGASLRFLPPYSPDFNPIELAFAKLKALLRAARPRTFDHVNALVVDPR